MPSNFSAATASRSDVALTYANAFTGILLSQPTFSSARRARLFLIAWGPTPTPDILHCSRGPPPLALARAFARARAAGALRGVNRSRVSRTERHSTRQHYV